MSLDNYKTRQEAIYMGVGTGGGGNNFVCVCVGGGGGRIAFSTPPPPPIIDNLHARIQEFSWGGGGGVQVNLTKKALTRLFF